MLSCIFMLYALLVSDVHCLNWKQTSSNYSDGEYFSLFVMYNLSSASAMRNLNQFSNNSVYVLCCLELNWLLVMFHAIRQEEALHSDTVSCGMERNLTGHFGFDVGNLDTCFSTSRSCYPNVSVTMCNVSFLDSISRALAVHACSASIIIISRYISLES